MHKIEIIENGDKRILQANDGDILFSLLAENNIALPHACAGKGICKKCTVEIDGKKELSCRYKIIKDISVTVQGCRDSAYFPSVSTEGGITENMCLCLDLGTTTLVLALVSIDDKKIVKAVSRLNPQKIFGADVMSRIEFAKNNGAEALQLKIISALNEMCDEILNFYDLNKVERLYLSGNTVMLHLFFGADCTKMGAYPYTPAFLEGQKAEGKALGVERVEKIESLPCISSFVGADIVAGLNLIDTAENDNSVLLVDLGTNAEIVLYSKDKILSTSAAAGPCFEGGNISRGMIASEGAIYSVDEKGSCCVIGGGKAKGICATGLIDSIARLLDSGIIDETGYANTERYLLCDDVHLTQGDIREFQLAKSAVLSGILTLLKIKKTEFEKVDRLYICGGFADKINISNAVRVGLIPKELRDKVTALGNSSLLGTVKYALEQNNLDELTNRAEYIDLAANEEFSKLFIENIMF